MNDTNPLIESENKSEGTMVRVMQLMQLVKQRILFVMITTIVVVALAAAYVFSLPRTFTSSSLLVPEVSASGSGLSGNLGALASMAGMKLGSGNSTDAFEPGFYPKILASTVFQTEVLKDTIYVGRLKRRMTVFEYFDSGQQQPWWGKLLPVEEKDSKADYAHLTLNPQKPTKRENRVMKDLSGSFLCAVDKQTDVISLTVNVQDADVAQQLADNICKRLQVYVTDYRTGKARKDLSYAKKVSQEAYDKYVKKQQEYASFCDANEDVTLASFQQVRDRLENEMQLAYNMYSQCAQQLQLAQVKLQERTPVFTTIQPATVPLKPSGPKRMFTVIIFFFLAFFGSVAWILASNTLKKAKAEV